MPRQLQTLMVINKSRNLPVKLKLKTLLIDIMTWGLWIYVGYFIYIHANYLLNLPIIDSFIFIEIIGIMFLIVFGLLCLTVLWSILTKMTTKPKTAEQIIQ